MIEQVLHTHAQLFDIFQRDVWDNQTDRRTIQEALQKIVDEWCKLCDMPLDSCRVQIGDLQDDSLKGEFRSDTNELWLEQKLVIDKLKTPYYIYGTPCGNYLSNKETLETLVHEFRHAMQNHYRNNPEKCTDKEYLTNVLLNTERGQNPKINAYFHNKGKNASMLYHLQFVERDAFLFAERFCIQFNDIMHRRHPEDLSFSMQDNFSNFWKEFERAKAYTAPQHPFVAIDNMIKAINNVEHGALNESIKKIVKQTQSKTWKQRQQEKKTNKFPFDMRPTHEQKQTQISNEEAHNHPDRDEREQG